METHGDKFDHGKPRLDLLDATFLAETARVLGFGAVKYAPHNWRKGLPVSKLVAAAQRHILAFNDGEDNDPESGLPHLAHASCCLMFLLGQKRPDLDDRFPRPRGIENEKAAEVNECPQATVAPSKPPFFFNKLFRAFGFVVDLYVVRSR